MKTLNIYVTKSLLLILFSAIFILTFGMLGGNLIKVLKLVSSGVPITAAIKVLLYMMPMIFSFTVPMGILVAVLLMFGKMSADNEITAMRACGISIFQIISPLIILTFALTALCISLQTTWAPYYMGQARVLTKSVGFNNPEALIPPGQPCSFDDMVVYVKNRDNIGNIKDIQIFTFDKTKQNIAQDITATTGFVKADRNTGILSITLYNYNIISYQDDAAKDRLYGKEFVLSIDVDRELNEQPLQKRVDFMTFNELMGKITLYKKMGFSTTEMETQLNLMFAMGLSPIAFLLLGFPLAIRTSRKETSVGLFISIILAGIFFFFVILCNTLNERADLYPQYLLWIPNIVYQIAGLYFLYKITKR